LVVALLALLPFAGPALAHGEQFARAEKIWPLLEEEQLPEELAGVTMWVEHSYYGTWIGATNDTGEPLEVYDDNGEPFLRISPDGVEYNRWAEEYYLTKPEPGTENRQDPPEEVRDNPDAPPEWVHLYDEPSVVWRDRRVETQGMDAAEWVPMEVRRAREEVDIGEWRVPVRLGEVETEVVGTYHYDGPPKGGYAATVTSEPANPDITVQLLHGMSGAADALTLQNRSGEPVTILDASGEPAIQVGPKEVQANMNSPVGRSADLQGGSSTDGGEPLETAEPEWKKILAGSNVTWLDPRLWSPVGQSEPDDPDTVQEVGRWDVPIEVAGEEVLLSGTIEWQPSNWQPPEESADTSGPADGIGFREVATVGAITVVPALAILALLLGPGLYKRYRYRR
jgi:hypothetical protein